MYQNPAGLSYNQLLKDIVDSTVISVTPTGKTLQEWADEWGYGMHKARRTMKGLITSGKMEVIRQPIIDIVGRINYTYTYKEL